MINEALLRAERTSVNLQNSHINKWGGASFKADRSRHSLLATALFMSSTHSYTRSAAKGQSSTSTDTTPAVTQPSTSHDTTETEKAIAKRREQFDKRFAPIWEAFHNAKPLSAADKTFLKKEFVSAQDYLYYSDVYVFRPGVELIDNRIALIYLPSAPHEAIARLMSLAVDRTYDCFPGGNLIDLGSSSMA